MKKKNSKKKKVTQIKKKIKEVKKEPTGLEKSLTEDSIKNINFQGFTQPITTPTPAPIKEENPTQTSLELDMTSFPVSQPNEKESKGNYTVQNEPQYSNEFAPDKEDEKRYESEFQAPVLSQTNSRELRHQVLTSPHEVRREIDDSLRRIETNIIEHKRKEPFETQQEKYREVKF
jgi:hypothetical protein